MTTQLIPVFDGSISNEKTLLCDARELHLFLGVRKDFSSWIRERIADYGFIENEDFILLTHFGEQRKGRGGHNRKDYHLTIHTAKELAMVERNDKGRQIRRYFIECERKLKQQREEQEEALRKEREKQAKLEVEIEAKRKAEQDPCGSEPAREGRQR